MFVIISCKEAMNHATGASSSTGLQFGQIRQCPLCTIGCTAYSLHRDLDTLLGNEGNRARQPAGRFQLRYYVISITA